MIQMPKRVCLLYKLNGISLCQERNLNFIDWKFKMHGIMLGIIINNKKEIELIEKVADEF